MSDEVKASSESAVYLLQKFAAIALRRADEKSQLWENRGERQMYLDQITVLNSAAAIIRRATPAELEAERPTPPKPGDRIEISGVVGGRVAVRFPGMKFDRTEGDDE